MKQLSLNYEEVISQRIKSCTLTARNRMQEIVEPYLKHINWDNKTLESDERLFYISCSRCWKRKTEYEFIKLMDWIIGKNLHPKQVIKLLMK